MDQSSSNKSLGIFLAVIGILLFSSKAVLVKLAYQYDTDAITILVFRMCFALPFYVLIALLKKPKQGTTRRDLFSLIGFGVLGYYLASYLDFKGLEYIKASLERLILFIYPTLVLLISFLFLGKRITRKQLIGVVITYLGIFVIFYSELTISKGTSVVLGGLLVFLSALTYASYLVGSGWLIPKFGATVFTSYAMIISCICILIHHGVAGTGDLYHQPSEVYLLGLAMAIFATVIPSYLISYAIKFLGANDFSIFGSLGPISTITLAYFFLGEQLTKLQFLGAAIVIAGILIAEVKKRNRKPKSVTDA